MSDFLFPKGAPQRGVFCNRTLNMRSIQVGAGWYGNPANLHYEVTNTTMVAAHDEPNGNSFSYYDMCFLVNDARDAVITDNTLIGCSVGAYIGSDRGGTTTTRGADDPLVARNTFVDTGGVGVWLETSGLAHKLKHLCGDALLAEAAVRHCQFAEHLRGVVRRARHGHLAHGVL